MLLIVFQTLPGLSFLLFNLYYVLMHSVSVWSSRTGISMIMFPSVDFPLSRDKRLIAGQTEEDRIGVLCAARSRVVLDVN
jgi:hypothetical protein